MNCQYIDFHEQLDLQLQSTVTCTKIENYFFLNVELVTFKHGTNGTTENKLKVTDFLHLSLDKPQKLQVQDE